MWKCVSLCFYILLFVYSGVRIYVQHFLDAVRNQTSNKKYLHELIKRNSEVHEKIVPMKKLSRRLSEVGYGLLTKYRE